MKLWVRTPLAKKKKKRKEKRKQTTKSTIKNVGEKEPLYTVGGNEN
jgi:hypothetical protein